MCCKGSFSPCQLGGTFVVEALVETAAVGHEEELCLPPRAARPVAWTLSGSTEATAAGHVGCASGAGLVASTSGSEAAGESQQQGDSGKGANESTIHGGSSGGSFYLPAA